MKTAVELYEAFLIELDRYGSPDAQVIDFIHFWNKAVYAFIENELLAFEETNIVSDRLRMISHGQSFSINSESCNSPKKFLDIPSDYFRLFGVKADFKYARDYNFIHKKGDTFSRHLKKLTADLEGFIAENRFYRPSIKTPYYQILDNKIHFLYEGVKPITELYVEKITLRYIKQPKPIALSDDFTQFNSSEFPVDVNHLILNLAVLLFMSTTGDQRIQLKSKL